MERPKLEVVPNDDRIVLKTAPLASIEMRSIVWLDKPLILGEAFTLVAGPKGVGKGTWLASQMAHMTIGTWREPANVLVISTEDSASIDLKPRCVAAGADVKRIHVVQERFTLPKDNGRLYHTALDCDAKMVVIDPVANHMNGADSDRESSVRLAVEGLNRLADSISGSVFGVRHINKNREKGALASVLGSTAWVDLPRAVLMFAPDDEDDMLFHVQVVAGNRAGRSAGRTYRIELADVGLEEPVTRVVHLGDSAKDVNDLLQVLPRRSTKSSDARELLLDILDERGATESEALDAEVAQRSGIAARTVRNLRTDLKNDGLIKAIPVKDESGAIMAWKVGRTAAPREPVTFEGTGV